MTRMLAFVVAAALFATAGQRQLLWSDEFDGAKGSPLDAAKWSYETGDHNPNNELEVYTDSTENVFHDGRGHLIIRALKENGKYTSGRVVTRGKFDVEYGRIEARIKIPRGQGIWPAFWMMGNENGKRWPDCGEIDIMENIGKQSDLDKVHGTVHGPGYSGGHGLTHIYTAPNHRPYADGFHVYAVEWKPDSITFLVDDVPYGEVTPSKLPPGTQWVYDHPFYLLLNVAVGGSWPGNPDRTTKFPQKMVVDWVRVYR